MTDQIEIKRNEYGRIIFLFFNNSDGTRLHANLKTHKIIYRRDQLVYLGTIGKSTSYSVTEFVILMQENKKITDYFQLKQIYYMLLESYFRKTNNFKMLEEKIEILEHALGIPEESRWTREKLNKEKQSQKELFRK